MVAGAGGLLAVGTEHCAARGLHVGAGSFAAGGLLLVPLVLLAAVPAVR